MSLRENLHLIQSSILIPDTTWKLSAPEGGANPHFFVPERKNGLF